MFIVNWRSGRALFIALVAAGCLAQGARADDSSGIPWNWGYAPYQQVPGLPDGWYFGETQFGCLPAVTLVSPDGQEFWLIEGGETVIIIIGQTVYQFTWTADGVVNYFIFITNVLDYSDNWNEFPTKPPRFEIVAIGSFFFMPY